MDTTFKFDTILSSLHDIQEVKSVNEAKLEEERNNRKQLESKVSKVAADLRSLSVRHSTLMETEQATRQKTLQLEKQIKHLEILNQEKSKKIEQLNKKITNEQELQQNDLKEFESLMTELSDKFRTAPKKYADENLDSSITELKENIAELKSIVSGLEVKRKELSEHKVSEETQEPDGELDEETMRLVLDMFTEEHKASEEMRKAFEEKERQLTDECTRLDNEMQALEQESAELSD